MTRRHLRGTLELTWMGKDQALIPTTENTYDYTWVDKNDPRACQTHYLVEEAHIGRPEDGGIHDNLLIAGESGDALEALTRVPELADKYVGRVKCVYIDPPFNTGGVFTHYEDNLEHSVWLTFMRDRLLLIKKLLAADGSIWVHLDDSENHRMRMLMDEVFGAGNFVSDVSWEKVYSPRGDSQGMSERVDRILVYRMSSETQIQPLQILANPGQFPHVDEQGRPYRSDPLRKWGSNSLREHRPTMWYGIESPTGETIWPVKPNGDEGRWRWKEPTVRERYDELDWLDKGNGLQPYVRQYADASGTRPAENLWLSKDVGHNQEAKEEIKALFPGLQPFDTPKPERLLERVLSIATSPGDIVLDCFAGSGTTAAVAHKMGRRWVTCELLEETVKKFTLPRLRMVIDGTDRGGISIARERVPAGGVELPEGVSPREAQVFSATLGKFADELTIEADLAKVLAADVRRAALEGTLELDDTELRELQRLLRKLGPRMTDLAPTAVRQLRASARTRDEVVERWEGGGGFDVARLSPVWVGVVADEVSGETFTYTTPEATGDVLERSVAAHLGFYLTPDKSRFVGKKGRQRLAVIEGMLSEQKAHELVDALSEAESVTVVCDGAPAGVSRALQKMAKGSRILVMPDDLFSYAPQGGTR